MLWASAVALLLACAVALLMGVTATSGSNLMSKFENRKQDNVIFTQNLLYEGHSRSKAECAVRCGNHADCMTFTFTKESSRQGTCRGHSMLMTNSAPVTAKENTQSYQIPAPTVCLEKKTVMAGSAVTEYCDRDKDNGNWTVIQRRQDGSVDFNRSWTEYQAGFGNSSGEFWLGLETLHTMTTCQRYEIRIDMVTIDNTTWFAVYSNFSVGPSSDDYRIHFDNMTAGNAPDTLAYHRDCAFATMDHGYRQNCASAWLGGWWFKDCFKVCLNCGYHTNFYWDWDVHTVLRYAAMKIRPA